MVDSIITLFESTSTEFSTNGLGTLSDAVSCYVTEERNGGYELELEYPITGKRYNDLSLRRIIVAKSNPYSNTQPFRIYNISKPFNGIVTVSAEHISYDLSGCPVAPFTAGTVVAAFSNMKKAAVIPCPYTFTTDKSTAADMTVTIPSSMRSLLGGVEDSILDIYGGEYEFDRYSVKLWNNRGSNQGVSIRYGKNLTDLKQEENCSAVYTGVYPFWYSEEDGLVELSEKIVKAEGTYNFERIYPLDLSQEWQEIPTEDQIRSEAKSYMKVKNIGVPKVSIDVSFVPLSQTEDYKDFAILETVHLCDTVNVYFPEMNVSATSKCIKIKFDVIAGKYDAIELGDSKSNLASTMSEQSHNINKTPTKTFMEQAIDHATKLITGGLGGHAIMHSSTGGSYPDEYLMLDTDSILTAKNLWRWNMGGFGHSSTGYNGNFDTAITMDGQIVADFITTGTLRGSLLQADSVQSTAISQNYKTEVTNEINQSAYTVEQNFIAADGQLLSTINETLTDYSTTWQMNSAITQTSSDIMFEVNKKVNNSEFGTKITQNYYSVQIAWNNISKYIEFSGGAMNIYQSTEQGSSNLLMKMNYSGAWYYYNGITIGKIGTNAWAGDSTFRGLVFDLEYEADYMTWAYRTSGSAGSYTVQMIYYANNRKAQQGLHFSCDTYCWGNLNLNENVRTVNWNDGGAGLYSTTHEVGIYGRTARVRGGCSFECTERRFAFWNSPDLLVDCYNNIDMHNYDILNQSDARLKTNIQPTGANALSLINQINLKSYDWIENGEHDEIGIIAQQLRTIIPDLVDENVETGRLSIKPNKFIPYLIKAIQELSMVNTVQTFAAPPSSETESWEDNMTLFEKMAFVEQSKIIPTPQPEESKQEEILIPIRNGGSSNG